MFPLVHAKKIALLGAALFPISCAGIDKPPTLDLTQPDLSQKELDEYVSDSVRYTTPYEVQILTPEQLEAFKVAEKELARVHESEIGAKNGIGLASDYLSVIGETNDFFYVAFMSRLRQNAEAKGAVGRASHWSYYYNFGNFQQIWIVLSKPSLSFECIAVLLHDCPEIVRTQARTKSK